MLACAASPTTGTVYCFGGVMISFGGFNFHDEILALTSGSISLQVGDPGDGSGAMANAWHVHSSRALKHDISALDSAACRDILGKVKATDVVRYRYTRDPQQTQHLGVIAEAAPREILSPGGVSVSLGDYTAFLMAALKAQQSVIEEKSALISDVQKQLAETQARLAELETRMAVPTGTEDGAAR